MFRFSADRGPVATILALTAVDFLLYFFVDEPRLLVIYIAALIVPKACIAAWTHHHQHSHVFRSKPLNRMLELVHALHTGITTNLWVLHHNMGHHRNFLDQTMDESRWKRNDGTVMGKLEYTFSIALTAHPRAYKVGERYPKKRSEYVTFTAVTVGILAALIFFKPLNALLVFVIPMTLSFLYTCLVTYGHHAELDTDDEFAASYNKMDKLYNFLTGNLGYHTAHHHRSGVHWSKLPELHEQIKTQIPDYCYTETRLEKLGLTS